MQNILLVIGLLLTSTLQAQPEHLAYSEQFILVTTQNVESFHGTLQRYLRAGNSSQWHLVGQSIPVVIGKKGVILEKDKKEGDKRTPMGVFVIGPAFGFSTTATTANQFDYFPLKETTICVDDINSKYYNQVIDSSSVAKPDWNSAERMHSIALYKHGSLIQYNNDERRKGAGSCIFMHIWIDNQSGTDGCIAMEEANLQQVLTWLDRKHNPTIGIFSENTYQELKQIWNLP